MFTILLVAVVATIGIYSFGLRELERMQYQRN